MISWFDMWFNVVKPRFLFKTVDLWSYIQKGGFPQILFAFQNFYQILGKEGTNEGP